MTFRGGEAGHLQTCQLVPTFWLLVVGCPPKLCPALGSGVTEHLNCPQRFDENVVTSSPPGATSCLEWFTQLR